MVQQNAAEAPVSSGLGWCVGFRIEEPMPLIDTDPA
jgi:hypothetical protein